MGEVKRSKLVFGGIASLLLASAPVLVSAVSNSSTTSVSATVSSVISISTLGSVSINVTPTSNGMFSSSNDTVTVSTNDTLGYTLKLADSDATTSLSSGANTIAASSATSSAATLSSGTWGFALANSTPGVSITGFDASYSPVTNVTGATSKWAGVPASGAGVTIKSTSINATNDTTNVYYAAQVNTTQPSGTYTDTVTYTATTN